MRFICVVAAIFVGVGISSKADVQSGRPTTVPVAPYLKGAFPETIFSGSGSYTQENYYPGLTFVEPPRIIEHPTQDRLLIIGKDGYCQIKAPATSLVNWRNTLKAKA